MVAVEALAITIMVAVAVPVARVLQELIHNQVMEVQVY